MIRPVRVIEANEVAPSTTGYLRALAALSLECADRPALLPYFLAIITLVPETIAELARERRRIAAVGVVSCNGV